MHLLTIVFGPNATSWALMFQNQEAADRAIMELEQSGPVVTTTDDFGQRVTLKAESIHGFMVEDMMKSQLANVERQMHHERFIAKVKQQASADQMIRSAHSNQGPAILNPMGNSRYGLGPG